MIVPQRAFEGKRRPFRPPGRRKRQCIRKEGAPIVALTMQSASQQNPEYRGSDASGDSLLFQSAPISLPR